MASFMCGICGIIDYNKGSSVKQETIVKMCSRMEHRGPDDAGVHIQGDGAFSVGLGHRRLKIIDLSFAGHQPMSNEDGTIWLVFNGEVYNYHELRESLLKKNHRFKSNSDTETVVHLYEEYGPDCVKHLRGMFAFAIWDKINNTLLLARDRVGKKPLVYSQEEGVFCFASEFSALLESGRVKKEVNFEAIHHYLTFGYVPAPLTIYKNVFKLPPAHKLVLKKDNISLERYWELDYFKKLRIPEEEAAEEVLRLLKESVRIRLYSDVPLGAFLSGGIDSSAVVGLMSQLSDKKVWTFSVGFNEKDYDELRYAKVVAEKFNTEHHEFIVRPKALEVLPLLVERYGEPYADSSCIPSYYVARQTRQHVTVALNGDGGDELFAGYERYQAMALAESLPIPLWKILSGISGVLSDSVNAKNSVRRLKRFLKGAAMPYQQRYLKWIGICDESMKKNIYSPEFFKKISSADPLQFIRPFLDYAGGVFSPDYLLRTDTMTYLPGDLLVKMDIASMANSLEARSPFLDHKLMEFVVSLPAEYKMKNFIKKYILKKAVRGLVPEENIRRRKMGFGVPVGEWFRGELREFLCQNILSEKALSRGYFDPGAIKNIVKLHIERKADYAFLLWTLLMLELWHERFID
ncbi:MAG: asparagine synthase (glutamine-hydrolyzing) [Candidatus Omnitrophica bacterium]|nr:asparagine synthase (glutamine-hydrolyzing) [Candidatus Omnitrophota bacterium]